MDPDQLLSIRNFGPRSLTELRQKLAEFGYLPESDAAAFGVGAGNYLDELASAMGDEEGGDETDADDVAEAIAALRGDESFGGRTGGEEDEG
jgi:hypothetical protein